MNDHIQNDVSISSGFKITEIDYDQGRVMVEEDIPTNPKTGTPYFEIPEDAWGGEWQAGEVVQIPDRTLYIDPNYKIVPGSFSVQEY